MDGRFNNQPFANEQDDSENSPENSADSPRSGMFHDRKMTSITSPKRSRRAIQKRVVSVPINDVEGSKLKGEISFPPSDSWAWRKYGQKPIKGSPYPRGYYRCSSSKGCPAKKQVERSRVDPNMLVVTYSCEHNHPWPAARNNHAHRNAISLNNLIAAAATSTAPTTRSSKVTSSSKAAAVVSDSEDGRDASDFSAQPEVESDDKFTNLGDSSSLIETDEFGWFSSFEPTTSTVIESSSILTEAKVTHADISVIFSMREEEEEESLFAGLGELPECSREFGIGMMERDEARRRHNLTPWCGTAYGVL